MVHNKGNEMQQSLLLSSCRLSHWILYTPAELNVKAFTVTISSYILYKGVSFRNLIARKTHPKNLIGKAVYTITIALYLTER